VRACTEFSLLLLSLFALAMSDATSKGSSADQSGQVAKLMETKLLDGEEKSCAEIRALAESGASDVGIASVAFGQALTGLGKAIASAAEGAAKKDIMLAKLTKLHSDANLAKMKMLLDALGSRWMEGPCPHFFHPHAVSETKTEIRATNKASSSFSYKHSGFSVRLFVGAASVGLEHRRTAGGKLQTVSQELHGVTSVTVPTSVELVCTQCGKRITTPVERDD